MAFYVYIVRSGSISAAARHFNLSISARSRWLQELESYFGFPLCHRTNRVITPTQAGKTLYEQFSPIVDRSEQITRQLGEFNSTDKGQINIAVTPVYANHVLMDKLSSYVELHPDVTFNLNVTPWALDHAAENDVAICANASFAGYKDKDVLLVKKELMQCPFVVVASNKYLDKHGTPTQPHELAEHRCLVATSLTGSNQWVFNLDNEAHIMKVNNTIEVNDTDLLLKLALNGTGIAYLPTLFADKYISDGHLNTLLNNYETSIWSLNIFYHPPNKSSAMVGRFKDFLLTP